MNTIAGDLLNYFKDTLEPLSDLAIATAKSEIDKAAQVFYDKILKTIPRGDTEGLAKSLTMTKKVYGNFYGYYIEFAGNNDAGQAYEKIANALSYGTQGYKDKDGIWHSRVIIGTKFIQKAVHTIKGLDERIYKAYEEKSEELAAKGEMNA